MLSPARDWTIAAAAALAIAAPTLVAHNVAPSPTFLNQALSFGLWGGLLIVSARLPASPGAARAGLPVWMALAFLGGAALWSWQVGSLPSSLGLSALATLLAAGWVFGAGTRAARAEGAQTLFTAYCIAWLVAAVLGAAVGCVQVFAPKLSDGSWIAHSSLAGRAVGNLRQPNHLSSILLWGAVALVALVELRRLALRVAVALMALLVFAVVLSASRTGLISVLLLALWGLVDRRLSRGARALLVAAPLVYWLAWQGMSWWGQSGEQRFGGQARLAETDISGSRFGIWSNTLELIRQQPWTGVGFGEFNFAWSLTPFPGRPTAFFDHTHNLPLQLLVELGLPLGMVVLGLLLWGLARAAGRAWRSSDDDGVMRRCAVVMLLMIGLHSLVEYPLWYAYFLLPAAWVWGFAIGAPAPTSSVPRASVPGVIAGAAMVIGAALSLADYRRVTVIFTAPEGAPSLEQRIAGGRQSWFFAHHADYAAATTALGTAANPLAPFRGATHYLLDTRLVTAWAQALDRNGRADEARHLAQRLREFRNPQSEEFFEACEVKAAPPPFQCEAPSRPLGWREFTR